MMNIFSTLSCKGPAAADFRGEWRYVLVVTIKSVAFIKSRGCSYNGYKQQQQQISLSSYFSCPKMPLTSLKSTLPPRTELLAMQMPQEMQLKLATRKMSIRGPHNAFVNASKKQVPLQGNKALAVQQS
jgi:hypothetical protein